MLTLDYNGLVVSLPSPDFRDVTILNIRTTIHQAMNGAFWTYIQTPALQTVSYAFSKLDRIKVQEVLNFAMSAMNNFMYLTDHNGQKWHGRIITTPITTTHVSHTGSSINFEFEGTKI